MAIFITILIMIIFGLCGVIWIIKQFLDYTAQKDAQILELAQKAAFHRGQSKAYKETTGALGKQNGEIIQTFLGRENLELPANRQKALEENTSPPPQTFQNVANDAQNAGTMGRGDAGDAVKKVDKRELDRDFHWSETVGKIGKFSETIDLIILERFADKAKFWANIPNFYDKDGNPNKVLEPFISDDDKSIKLLAGACQEKSCATIFITQDSDARFCSPNCRKKDWKQNN